MVTMAKTFTTYFKGQIYDLAVNALQTAPSNPGNISIRKPSANWPLPYQQIACENDGAITLSFPVSDLREVKREVLRYGAQAEVIAPPALRNEMAAEIKKMQNIYLVGYAMGDQV